jgi:hypothetical protein
MPIESDNGAEPSNNGSDPVSDPGDNDARTPFERFEGLTRQLLSVPKAELDKRRAKDKRPRSTKAGS